MTIAGGASYYGFLWGSPDSYNTVSFFNGAALLRLRSTVQLIHESAER